MTRRQINLKFRTARILVQRLFNVLELPKCPTSYALILRKPFPVSFRRYVQQETYHQQEHAHLELPPEGDRWRQFAEFLFNFAIQAEFRRSPSASSRPRHQQHAPNFEFSEGDCRRRTYTPERN